ncbi:MAG: hypothetical protein J2P23_06990 [Microlunatus sp.]|nr:hypothetical protein [Microlunatus sp.]
MLEILPGVGAAVGGLVVLATTNRQAAIRGAWLAAFSGVWFVVGVPLSAIWAGPTVGRPVGGTTLRFLEYVGFFGGLGVAIVFFAAFALGRVTVSSGREVEQVRQTAPPEDSVTTVPAVPPQRKPATG